MNAFTIRPFVPSDGDALADLHRRAILAQPEQYYTLAERESWAFGLKPELYGPKDGAVLEVAVPQDGRAVAFCHNAGDRILGLYVDPDWQGRGLGSALLQRAEKVIATGGHAVVKVEATISARGFYGLHGYRFVTDRPHKTRGGLVLSAVVLEKPIVT